MQLIDLSREIHHRTPAHPSHPPVVMTVWNDHTEIKRAGTTEFTSKAMYLSLSDHAGTHVDAPCHFNPDPKAASIDQVPLENFYTEAICLDLSHVPLKHEITVAEMEAALAKSGQSIKKRDTVLHPHGRQCAPVRQARLSARLSGSARRCGALAGRPRHPDVRRRGDQPGARGRAELQGAHGVRASAASRTSNACGTSKPWSARAASASSPSRSRSAAAPRARSARWL